MTNPSKQSLAKKSLGRVSIKTSSSCRCCLQSWIELRLGFKGPELKLSFNASEYAKVLNFYLKVSRNQWSWIKPCRRVPESWARCTKGEARAHWAFFKLNMAQSIAHLEARLVGLESPICKARRKLEFDQCSLSRLEVLKIWARSTSKTKFNC